MGRRGVSAMGVSNAVALVALVGAFAAEGAAGQSSGVTNSDAGVDTTAPLFGFLGAASALVFSCAGAAYGTARSGLGITAMGVMRPELIMKSTLPAILAGVLGVYGLIIGVIISTGIAEPKTAENPFGYTLYKGYAHLSSGLATGLTNLAAGMCIGVVGDAGVRANAQQPKLYIGMMLILIFAEALALFGLIVGLILAQKVV